MIRYLILTCLFALPLIGQDASQCTLFPDVLLSRVPAEESPIPHLTLTNASLATDHRAHIVVTFWDAGDHTFPGIRWEFDLIPREKARINLATVWGDFREQLKAAGKSETAFLDGFMRIRSSGQGDVRTVLEQSRGGLPLREYGQRCEPSPR